MKKNSYSYSLTNRFRLVIIREGGTFGRVLLSYRTVKSSRVDVQERHAVPEKDFTPVHGNVTFEEKQKQAVLYIPIVHVRFLNQIT